MCSKLRLQTPKVAQAQTNRPVSQYYCNYTRRVQHSFILS